jgi:hypothetical protein
MYIKQDDPEIPTFYFDPVINPISAYRMEETKKYTSEMNLFENDEELDEFVIEEDLRPILEETPLCDSATTEGKPSHLTPRHPALLGSSAVQPAQRQDSPSVRYPARQRLVQGTMSPGLSCQGQGLLSEAAQNMDSQLPAQAEAEDYK